jgi:mono/diheme cytochrome c family protein
MRPCLAYSAAALAILVGNGALAQDADNGRRIWERSCANCHGIDASAGKPGRAISFAAIAAKPGMSAETISSFLLMAHVAMTGSPISKDDARDAAAFVMSLKN